jgi:glycosyltransferase 2 family protein
MGTGLVGLAVSVAALVILASVIDLEDTWETLVSTDLRWVALTLVMVPFQVLLRTARWRLLLPRRADGSRPPLLRVMPVLLIGYFGNLILPARLGEPVRAYLLARRERLSLARVLGSVLLERVIDLATLAFAAVAAAIIAGAPAWMVRGMLIVTLVGVAVGGVLAASGIERAVAVLARVLGRRAARVRLVLEQATRFGEGAGGTSGLATLAAAVVISGATWLFVAATYWLLARSLGMDLSIAGSLLVAAVTTLGTAIPSAPAHIGTFEVAAVVAATSLGVPPERALALALLAHVITTLPFALAGAAAVTMMSVSLGRVASAAQAATARAAPAPDR